VNPLDEQGGSSAGETTIWQLLLPLQPLSRSPPRPKSLVPRHRCVISAPVSNLVEKPMTPGTTNTRHTPHPGLSLLGVFKNGRWSSWLLSRWDSFVPGDYNECHRKPKGVYCAPYGCLYLTGLAFFLVAYWHVTGFKAKFGVLMASRYILRAYSATYTGRMRLYRPHSYAGGMGSRQEGRDWPFTYR
jgi:hypothetical protein